VQISGIFLVDNDIHSTILELNTESYRMKAAKVAKNHSHETTKKMEESNVK